MTSNRLLLGTFLTAAALVAGCAKSPDSIEATTALKDALVPELNGASLESLPKNKSLVTNFNGGRQFLVAKKVDNLPGQPTCSLFDVTVSRPSEQLSLFGRGDSGYQSKVKICL